MTFPCAKANATDVIKALGIIFTSYATPKAVYSDREQHFENQAVKDFLTDHKITDSFSPSGSSQSTGIVEIGNKILEDVVRKGGD